MPRRERPRRNTAAQAQDPYTLIVALDESQGAKGSLYVDDGRSFAFLQGVYLEAEITYSARRLTYRLVHQGLPDYQHAIERIVVIGADAGAPGASVSDGRQVDVEWGPVTQGQVKGGALVIRQPGVTIASDWTIQLDP